MCAAVHLPRVGSLVNLEIFRSCEHLAATSEWTCERLLTGVHADVIHKFVFGFERAAMPRAVEPQARVCRLFGGTDVFDSQVTDCKSETRCTVG